MQKFDLLVIGTGPSGGTVARKCAAAGWKVAIVESRAFGGTCALRGCNPKKVFVHAAEIVDAARRSDGKLCDSGGAKIDWANLIAFKKTFTESIPKSSREGYEEKGIKTFLGKTRFVSPTKLRIDDETIEPKHVVIATGAKPRPLEIPGAEFITTSDQFMELEQLPKRVVFIGGGYISFEFAHVAVRADSQVTILERNRQPLRPFEATIVDRLVEKSRAIGMSIRTDAVVEKLEQQSDGSFLVTFTHASEPQTIEADLVVHGAGRVPNLDGLDLETGQIDFDAEEGVTVNERLQSRSNQRVYAAGDCAATGVAPLTPTANVEGRSVAKFLLGQNQDKIDYGPVPAVVFTIPPIASVGMTEQQASKTSKAFRIEEGDMSDWGSVKKVCETTGAYKLIIENESDTFLGAHVIAPNAADLINLFAVAMKFDISASELKSVLLAFPTSTYDVRQMI